MKKYITPEMIMEWGPCYDEQTVRRLYGRRKRATVLEILHAPILDEDKLWVVLREGFIQEETLRLFACACAERALRRERKSGREPDKRSWTAIRVARRFANGKATGAELNAASAAASDAAWDAAWDAASAAASDAAWGAAWGAAWDAASDAERKWQVRWLIRHVQK